MTTTPFKIISLKEYLDIWYGPGAGQIFEYSCCICYEGTTDTSLLKAIVKYYLGGSDKHYLGGSDNPIGYNVVCSDLCFNMWLLQKTNLA